VGYVETPDFARAVEQMSLTDVNHRWQSEMAEFFESAAGQRADEQLSTLAEVFHLA
jgi:L-rhamnose mutarotase